MAHLIGRRAFVTGAIGSAAALTLASGRSVWAQGATPQSGMTVPVTIIAGPGSDEFTVTHRQGETVVKANPAKIVSYDLGARDTLETLGISLAGVPDTAANELFGSQDAEFVGSLSEPDFEALAALEPDLIIGGGRTASVIPDLSKIGPTIDVSQANYGYIDSFKAVSMTLATLIGKEADAEARIAQFTPRLDALKNAAASVENGLFVLITGGAVNAVAPGPLGGRGALIYQELGIKPPVEDLEAATHGEPVSFEFLLEHDPQFLFVVDRDAAIGQSGAKAAESVLDNDIVKETRAFKDDHIVYLNPFDWYSYLGAGMQSLDRMLTDLEAALLPDQA